jgi:probable rRNA maturation factor
MVNIDIDDNFKGEIDALAVIRAVDETLKNNRSTEDYDLSVVIGSDEQISELNFQFRGIATPTDVLSFPSGEVDPDSGNHYLGDVIISFPQARKQALLADHTVTAEIQLLIIHGVLHLLGYDHADENEKTIMWSLQSELLNRLGTRINRLPE